ncbi:hypothetical protein CUJ83_02445 [Methanocella sp. CWC-04]|uniref:Metal-binding protein n=1 Tax=Methanooceanicella nereidis TaxID=2052831 RepID=A0AAP2RB98_9EURY|nr:DUF2284 domain-containing protein [Methanocella sp. CWC-04]MCD1293857.1 hypothetical protein [Methanocella sp. CWC-04]
MPSEDFDQHLKSFAQELGITDIKRIPVMDIIVDDWVRLKCQYGCPNYGRRLTCPPHSPAPDAMRKILESYSKAFIIRYDVPGGQENMQNGSHLDGLSVALDTFFKLERFTFLNGYRKVFVFGLNYCPGCEECIVLSDPDAPCLYPVIARPSLEACGIDVQQTLENAGWGPFVRGRDRLMQDDIVSMISIILVE